MLSIKVLGSGCANCKRLETRVRKVCADNDLDATIEKVTDYQDIMRWPILSTPGLVINDTLVSQGRIPAEAEIARMLKS